jgi:hypothetical protein
VDDASVTVAGHPDGGPIEATIQITTASVFLEEGIEDSE